MIDYPFDWHKIKYYESTENLKHHFKSLIGRTISTTLAQDISIWLNQGRLFYQSAAGAPLEIRPLLIFYGMMAFAKAITIARSLKSSNTLTPSHGLKSNKGAQKMEDLSAKIEATGTFQGFNDNINSIQKISCYKNSLLEFIYAPTARSSELFNMKFSLKDILSRIPGLEDLYEETFHSEAKVLKSSYYNFREDLSQICYSMPVFIKNRKISKLSFIDFIRNLRASYPFLNNWCFDNLTFQVSEHVILFYSACTSAGSDIAEENLIEYERGIRSKIDFRKESHFHPLEDIIAPGAGVLQNQTPYFIAPFNNLYIAEASYYYLGMFVLSSAVRYQPHIWVHALTGSSHNNMPPDNAILALIERFLDLSLIEFPKIILASLKEPFPSE